MADHDQRFKALLREFFPDFFRLFFPQWVERFDFTQIEWLDKELFVDPPRGERVSVDVVAQLPTREAVPAQRSGEEDTWIALVHVEVEHRQSAAALRPRMFDYYQQLRLRHRKPVLPIGLYLQVGLGGIGTDAYEERFWDFRVIRFDYLYVGLPALDARAYLEGDNWLGVALSALMKLPEEQKALFKAEAWRRLIQCPENAYRKFLLCECVDAYLPLSPPQQQDFQEIVTNEPYQGATSMVLTMFEEMLQKKYLGLVQMQLQARFGSLKPEVQKRLQSLSPDQLFQLAVDLVTASSLKELGLED